MTEQPALLRRDRKLQARAILHEKARHCRELAFSVSDMRTKRILFDMARGFDDQARTLDAEQPDSQSMKIPRLHS